MSPENWEQIGKLYHAALEHKPDRRPRFLDEACGGDEDLREQVERLLASEKETKDFLEEPAIDMVARKIGKDDAIPETIGHYKILQILGEGGMGTVYLAEQEEPIHRRVALKVVKLGMVTEEVIARFDSERQTLGMMDHPNIANVLDAGTTDQGLPYFVMEYVDGVSISDYCDSNRLNTRERLQLFIPVCQAVQHAHQKGIVHRDIKPSNVLVIVKDDKPIPKVIDFGVAKATNQRLTEKTAFTQHGLLVGTPEYMSPEQAEIGCLDVDATTDIYSLGVVLYELLVGALPYDPRRLRRAGYNEIQRILREEEPQTPAVRFHSLGYTAKQIAECRHTDIGSLERQLRGDLDWIVMKAMEKDRTRRYQSASELKEDINRHLNDEAVLAHPPSTVYRLGKFIQKNRTLVASLAGILVILSVASIISIGLWLRADRAREESERRLVALHEEVGYRELLQGNTLQAAVQLNEAYQAGADNPSLRFRLAETMMSLESQVAVLRGHTGRVRSVAFSPDGRYVVTSSVDTTARLWNSSDGSLAAILGPHEMGITSAVFSPNGSLVLTAGFENIVRIWSVPDGKLQMKLECPVQTSSAAFSPDGSLVATSSADNKVRLWEAASGRLHATLEGHKYRPAVHFSPDGSRIMTIGGLDGTAKVWDVSRGRLMFTIDTQPVAIYSAGFSKDGSRIFTGSQGIKIWDGNTGGRIYSLFPTKADQDIVVKFSGDCSRALISNGDGTARVVDTNDGSLLASLTEIWAYSYFSPDASQILAADGKGTLSLYNLPSGWQTLTLQGHEGRVDSVAFSPNGSLVATAGEDGTARLWNISKTRLQSFLKSDGRVSLERFSPDGSRILTDSFPSKSVELWDTAAGKLIASLIGHSGGISDAAFSPDGSKIITRSYYDWGPMLWDAHTGRWLAFIEGHSAPLLVARFNPDGSRIVTGSADNTAKLWDVSSTRLLRSFRGHTKRVADACFSPDGSLVATASPDMTAKVWNANTGQLVFNLANHTAGVDSVIFNPQGTIIATSSAGTTRLWDVRSGKLLSTLEQNMGSVSDSVFSPEGDRILTLGNSDKIGKVWDVASGKLLFTLEIGTQGLGKVAAFTRNGLIIIKTMGQIQIWDATNGKLITTLSDASIASDRSAILSPDGNAVIRIGNGGIGVWEIRLESRSREQIAEIFSRYFGKQDK